MKVSYVGSAMLSKYIQLDNVLYIPSFNYNLLSVSKLIKASKLCLHFLPICCILQDPLTKRIIAVGREKAGLYKLNHMCFFPDVIDRHLLPTISEMPAI